MIDAQLFCGPIETVVSSRRFLFFLFFRDSRFIRHFLASQFTEGEKDRTLLVGKQNETDVSLWSFSSEARAGGRCIKFQKERGATKWGGETITKRKNTVRLYVFRVKNL